MAQKFTQNFAPGSIAPMGKIHDRLKQLRGGTPQAEFAQRLGVGQSTYGRYERGETQPDVVFLQSCMDRLGIEPRWLISGEGPMKASTGSVALAHEDACPCGSACELPAWPTEGDSPADPVSAAEPEAGSVLDDPRLAPILEMMEGQLQENGQLKMENLKLSMKLDAAVKMIENYRARLEKRR